MVNPAQRPVPFIDDAADGKLASVKKMLAGGADINQKDEYGQTALMAAAGRGAVDVCSFLIGRGAALEEKTNVIGSTAMIQGVCGQDDAKAAEIVRALIAAGADINARDNYGRTAVMMAAFKGHSLCLKLLVDKGARLDFVSGEKRTALGEAVITGKADIVQLLIDKDAAIGGPDIQGKDEIAQATERRHPEIAQMLRPVVLREELKQVAVLQKPLKVSRPLALKFH